MRKVILALAVSLDGYIARENGDVDWLALEDLQEGADEMSDFFSSIDAMLLGRKTYEKGLEMSGEASGGGVFGGGIKTYVFTRAARASTDENLQFVSTNVKEFVSDLKSRKGKNIYLMGGGELAKTFFEEGLIDEMILGIQAKIIGRGIPLFLPHDRESDLELLDVKRRKSGSAQVTYRVGKSRKLKN